MNSPPIGARAIVNSLRRLVLRAAARRELKAIQIHISDAANDPKVGRDFTRGLFARCQKLAELPGTLGRSRTDLAPAVRSLAHGRYVIFFVYVDDALVILTVLHGARDMAAAFREAL